jgi:hypothetical protein
MSPITASTTMFFILFSVSILKHQRDWMNAILLTMILWEFYYCFKLSLFIPDL